MNKKLLYLFLAMHCAAAFAGDNQSSASQKESHALRNNQQEVLKHHGIYPDSSTAAHAAQRKAEQENPLAVILNHIGEQEQKKRQEMEEWYNAYRS